ncbi:Mitochondrial Fe2 transporter MMT1 and related transporters (cation diffusion facilitator superfamily) [Phaffia rhodozyma]|uniref:Mitochondrial Fe2 transporter MMT1 and related transporters (Cation diffusion facilitator superfamily) n=1 Tax=Phaffia rhodozyma TaxID=264483 RepID=A0A0F7SV37_PHARH|nr:Mitochondrial Fe2 transporter MMT1 and related transporters (cation diffusion facilitator superfamily) [Phaffia rhodozyma]
MSTTSALRQSHSDPSDPSSSPRDTSSTEPKKPAKAHSHSHSHDHSHSSFNPFHSHSGGHSHSHATPSPDSLRAALMGKGDRGSRVTLLGLASNVGLTGLKLFSGWRYNSASLLAEAGHSASDLLGDFVTLFCYNMSRQPPSKMFPVGFSKFDTLGMLTVSAILVVGSIGIGIHSYSLLTNIPFSESNILHYLPHLPHALAGHHSHTHEIALDESGGLLDPNAAWTALLSVVVKEWMYRITKKVGEEENSSVLAANALHHRSDALTSFIALLSILGSTAGVPILDPLGGILVSTMLLYQSSILTYRSTLTLLDSSCDEEVLDDVRTILQDLREEQLNNQETGTPSGRQKKDIRWDVRSLKGIGSGAGARIELELGFSKSDAISLKEAQQVERMIKERVMAEQSVHSVRVSFIEVDELSSIDFVAPLN